MKYILTQETVDIPQGVEVTVKSRNVEVKGPLGILKRNFKSANVDIQRQENKKKQRRLLLQLWQAGRKEKCVVNTISTHIKNMVRGVQRGYKFKMVFAFAHFPIIANVIDKGHGVEIKNFLGEKIVRTIKCLPGVVITRNEEEKNMLTLTGTDLNNVSLTCALIHQSVRVKHKDIRQFLDGIYVQDKRLDMN